jgi:hypothetical protein
MCVAFDETGSILWTGDDRGNMFAALFDMTTGKLHSCKRYMLKIMMIVFLHFDLLSILEFFLMVMVQSPVFPFDFVPHVMDVKDIF